MLKKVWGNGRSVLYLVEMWGTNELALLNMTMEQIQEVARWAGVMF